MEWERRPNITTCRDRDYIDCPRCGCGVVCMHEDNIDGECTEESCPRFDGKRWKKEDE